ncbi:lysine biosynthesis protein LysX [Nitrososphaera sp.]|uniref:lysine biosynthesis protein LysX n=1 Tax=Nitrososphaera sp. TaxID=1971748 RepID=UPI00179786C1|nr:lysine biosynthesis protein LysX [Nitrososphaera sp.]NWG37272.1 lysine biosynthesis protein LysX [Nitrososphaera sp.]
MSAGDGNTLAILYDTIRWEEKALYEAARKKGVSVENVDIKALRLRLGGQSDFKDRVVLQRSVSYFKSLHATAALEGLGAKVINPLKVAGITGNKLFAHMELEKAGVRTPKAIAAFSEEAAIQALDEFGYPAVIKPTVGSWGRMIGLLRDRDAARAVIEDREHMFPLYHIYYFEEFVKRPPRDIRAIVVGDRVVAAIYRYSGDGEWKTNMALGGRAEVCPVTEELNDICMKATRAVGGQIVGVDLMEGDDGLMVHEVNNTTEFKNTVRVTGVDIPSLMVDYALSLYKR